MKLPEKFKFVCEGGNIVYSAEVVSDMVEMTWESATEGMLKKYKDSYPLGLAAGYVEDDKWKIIEGQYPNGEDAKGNPLNFNADMLKPFMRIATSGAASYIVRSSSGEEIRGVREHGIIKNHLSFDVLDLSKSLICAVYAEPEPDDLLNPLICGKLLWIRTSPEAAQKKQAIRALEQEIANKITELQILKESKCH
jgi:hypothetical protein